MRITLEKPFCGKSPGDEMSVSDARGVHLMKEGIAKADAEILEAAGEKKAAASARKEAAKEKATSKRAAHREKAEK